MLYILSTIIQTLHEDKHQETQQAPIQEVSEVSLAFLA